MTTIYIVTEGSYSDLHNVAVFSTYEAAALLSKMLSEGPYDHSSVEEFELDEMTPEQPRAPRWFALFYNDRADLAYIYLSEFGPEQDRGIDGSGQFWTYVDAPDKEAAAKIAMERRSVFLANHIENN